jgi:hypothetical protein
MNSRGHTLISMLVTLAIIAILMVVMMKGSNMFGASSSPRADGKGTTVPGLVKASAQDEVCKNNLNSVRQSIQITMATTGDEEKPASMAAIQIGDNFKKCPMGGEPYTYNATTGEVRCTHPGHEKY